jgi:hypothetical protein
MAHSFLVHDVPVSGPATHALVIGAGAYPHLSGGTKRLTDDHDGMGQLTSPPISSRMFAAWLMEFFHHPDKQLATVSLLVSESKSIPFVNPRDKTRSFKPQGATSANVAKAVREWFVRGNTHHKNLMLFYFCGHGISAGTDMALLLSDYGADPLNSLEGALDFRQLRLGMQRCQASEQCFFVDACRASSDTLISAGFAGKVVIQPKLRNANLPKLRAPVFYSSMKGDKAYALPGRPSVFTDALLEGFKNLGAGEEEGDWRVSSFGILDTVDHLVPRRMQDLQKVQVPNSDDMVKIYLHYLSGQPDALVYVTTEPPDALGNATLTYEMAGGTPVAAPLTGRNSKEWELRVPAGSYNFTASYPTGPPRIGKQYIKPAYQRVRIKVAMQP